MTSRSLIVAAFFLTLTACGPGGFEADVSAADVTLDNGDESLQLIHDPSLSQIELTPPVGGEVELLFSYQDPLVELVLRLDAESVTVGDVVSLPADPAELSLTLSWGGLDYESTTGAQGGVELLVLELDEAASYASLNAEIDAELVASSGETVTVNGFVDSTVGEPAEL